MKASDVRAMSDDQLLETLASLSKERMNLRFQAATGQLEKTSRCREVRRDAARLRTIASERRRSKKESS